MRALLAVLVLSSLAAPASADLLSCRFKGESSWVPKTVVIEAGREGDEVQVYDPLIKLFQQRPIRAVVETDNAARTTFTWSYKVKSPANQTARLSVRMTRQKRDGRATISVTPLGFQGPFGGRGSCEPRAGKL